MLLLLLLLVICSLAGSSATDPMSPCHFTYTVDVQSSRLDLTCECKGVIAACLLERLNSLEIRRQGTNVSLGKLDFRNQQIADGVTNATLAVRRLRLDIPADDKRTLKFECILSATRETRDTEQYSMEVEISLDDYYVTTPTTTQDPRALAAQRPTPSLEAGTENTTSVYLVVGICAGVVVVTVSIVVICLCCRRKHKLVRRRRERDRPQRDTAPSQPPPPPPAPQRQSAIAVSTLPFHWEAVGQLLRGLISPPVESHSRGYRQRLSRFVPSFFLSSNLRTYSEPYAECCLSSRSGCTGGNATVHRRFTHSERGGRGLFSPLAAGGGSQNGLQTHAKQQGSPENHHHHRHPCRLPEAEPDTFNPTSLAPPIPHHWHRPTALPVPLGENSPACLGPSSLHRDRETVQGGCRDHQSPPSLV